MLFNLLMAVFELMNQEYDVPVKSMGVIYEVINIEFC